MVTIDRDLTAVHAQEAAAAFAEAVARLPSDRACRNSRHSWWKDAGCSQPLEALMGSRIAIEADGRPILLGAPGEAASTFV